LLWIPVNVEKLYARASGIQVESDGIPFWCWP
jgi:hypothetical protein